MKAKPTPRRKTRPVRRTTDQRLQTVEKLLELMGRDLVRLIDRLPKVETVHAALQNTREHNAILASQVRRLLGEKDAREAYIRNLEEQVRERAA